MRVSDKDIKFFLKQKPIFPYKEEEVSKTILKAKEAFYMAEAEEALSETEFLYYQSKYIRKRWWILQGLLLLGVWLFLKYSGSNFYIQRSIGVAASLFVILIIPEIWRNKSTNAMEIEGTTRYSLRQIYSARLVLFAVVDLTLLSLFSIAVSFTNKLMIRELMIQFFVPFNVTCCICFRSFYSNKVMSGTAALLLCMIWAVVWMQIVLCDVIYKLISTPLWIVMLALSVLYLVYIIRKGQKQCMEMWEVKTLWN